MTDEINGTPSEFNSPIKSTKDVVELRPTISSLNAVPDLPSYDELNGKAKSKKTAAVVSKILSSAAVLAIVVTMFFPSGGTSLDAEFIALSCTDTTISYEILIKEFPEGSDVSVVVYNDFTHRVQTIKSEATEGEVTGLKPNVSYTIAIKDGKKTVLKQTIRTKA